MHKNLEPRPTANISHRLRPAAHQGVPTISRIEREMARHLPLQDRARQIPLMEAIEQRFARITVRDVIDIPRRAATGDSDFDREMEYLA